LKNPLPLASFNHPMLGVFWKAKALNGPNKILKIETKTEVEHLGKTSFMNDLPKDA
jgi:hypothetical protein